VNKIALKVEIQILDYWGERSLSRKETRMANPLEIKFGPVLQIGRDHRWSKY
jgi:hypothetical protein